MSEKERTVLKSEDVNVEDKRDKSTLSKVLNKFSIDDLSLKYRPTKNTRIKAGYLKSKANGKYIGAEFKIKF